MKLAVQARARAVSLLLSSLVHMAVELASAGSAGGGGRSKEKLQGKESAGDSVGSGRETLG